MLLTTNNTSDLITHNNLGVTLRVQGSFEASVLAYRKAIQIDPKFADAYYNLGIILKDLGKLKEAELTTRKAIKIDPTSADAHLNLGKVLTKLHNQLNTAANTVGGDGDSISRRLRAMDKQLKNVEGLPSSNSNILPNIEDTKSKGQQKL